MKLFQGSFLEGSLENSILFIHFLQHLTFVSFEQFSYYPFKVSSFALLSKYNIVGILLRRHDFLFVFEILHGFRFCSAKIDRYTLFSVTSQLYLV
jgi:hypothetical protein